MPSLFKLTLVATAVVLTSGWPAADFPAKDKNVTLVVPFSPPEAPLIVWPVIWPKRCASRWEPQSW